MIKTKLRVLLGAFLAAAVAGTFLTGCDRKGDTMSNTEKADKPGMAETKAIAQEGHMNANGIVDVPSSHSVAETADRLASLLQSKDIKIFARIDQAAEARAVGLTMRPMVLLIFGDPKGGTPLMNRYTSIAMDLPLKALVWESAEGKVLISYNSPEYLQQRHGLPAPPFGALGNLLKTAAQ